MKIHTSFPQLLALICICTSILWGQKSTPKTIQLRLAVPLRNFDELSREDASLAMDLWIKEIVRDARKTEGLQFNVQSVFLDNSDEQVDFSNNQNYDILLLSALDFLEFRLKQNWHPIALTRSKGHFPEEYLLLARAKSADASLGDLRGKHIIFAKNQDARIILFWLGNLLNARFRSSPRDFFATIEEKSSASKAVLAVFFGKADVCVVGYNQYATMAELNPQIKTQLKVIERSSPFARGMVCLNKALDTQIKRIVTRAVLELPASDRGQQILRFFNQSDLIPYKSGYLDSFRAILDATRNGQGAAQ